MSKEQLKSTPDASADELKVVVDALESQTKPEGKVIPIREISLKEEREINRRLSAVEEDLIILEDSLHQLVSEDLANVSEAIQYLKQEKEQLFAQFSEPARDRRLKLRSDFAKLKRRSAKSLEEEREELREVRQELASQPTKKLEEVLLPKGMELEPPPVKKSWIQNLREFFGKKDASMTEMIKTEKALVPQTKPVKKEHKDWGAWKSREPLVKSLLATPFLLGITIFPLDLANWSYRKIKRLMGKGAELDAKREADEQDRMAQEMGMWGPNLEKKIDQEREQKNEPKTFTSVEGGKIESTGEQEKYGLHVGGQYRLINDKFSRDIFPDLTTSEIVEIVGFTKIGDVIIELNGERFKNIAPSLITECFNPISEDYPLRPPPKFEY